MPLVTTHALTSHTLSHTRMHTLAYAHTHSRTLSFSDVLVHATTSTHSPYQRFNTNHATKQ